MINIFVAVLAGAFILLAAAVYFIGLRVSSHRSEVELLWKTKKAQDELIKRLARLQELQDTINKAQSDINREVICGLDIIGDILEPLHEDGDREGADNGEIKQ